jgi:hypothetical protein
VRVSDSKEQWYTTGHAEPQVKAWQSQEASKWQQEAGAVSGQGVLQCTWGHWGWDTHGFYYHLCDFSWDSD